MRVAIPHRLPREEVRRRLKARAHEIAEFVPGGMAQVTTAWPGEDRMDMQLTTLGQTIEAGVEIEDATMIIVIDLPAHLSFVSRAIEGAVREKGTKLLA